MLTKGKKTMVKFTIVQTESFGWMFYRDGE